MNYYIKENEKMKKTYNIQKENEKFYLVMDDIDSPIVLVNLDCSVIAMNKEAQKLTLFETKEANNKCYKAKYGANKPCRSSTNYICPIDHIKKEHQTISFKYEYTDEMSNKKHFEIQIKPLFNDSSEMTCFLEISHDITEYIVAQEKLEIQSKTHYHSSMHDALTLLPNRRLLMQRTNQAINRKNLANEMFGIFFIDLDHFKEINDTQGHDGGDQLLREVANRLQEAVRKSDTVARFGGDEFVIIIENDNNKKDFNSIAKKILECFLKPFKINNNEVFISCSIGISLFPLNATNTKMLFEHADTAMYKAKKQGRNQYVFY